jgi:hypothetical protein
MTSRAIYLDTLLSTVFLMLRVRFAMSSLLVGTALTLVTAALLFNINWTYFGSTLIILAGLGILVTAMLRRK